MPAFTLVGGLMVEQPTQTRSTIRSNFERKKMFAIATRCVAEETGAQPIVMANLTKSYLSMRSTFKYVWKTILTNTAIAIETSTVMLLLPVHATKSTIKSFF